MKETMLMKVALSCSIIGLFALVFISQNVQVPDYTHSEIKNVGEDVKFSGKVLSIDKRDGMVFMELVEENQISSVMFTKDNVMINEGDDVEVIGQVQEYGGKLEIIAQNIRVVE